MAYIGRDPQYGAFEKQALTADGSTTTFTLDYTVGSSSSILVSVAGVHQEPEVAYNLATNGTQITFTAAPASGDTVFVIFLGVALEVATIGSGIITSRTELAEQAADDDLLLVYDTSATSLKKIQKSNIATTLTYNTRTGTGDGSTTTFTLDYTVGSASSLLVSVAGVHQEPEVAYNLATNGTQITFTAAPASGDTVFVIFLGVALEVLTVGTGVITGRTELAEQAADDDLLLIYDTSTTSLKKI